MIEYRRLYFMIDTSWLIPHAAFEGRISKCLYVKHWSAHHLVHLCLGESVEVHAFLILHSWMYAVTYVRPSGGWEKYHSIFYPNVRRGCLSRLKKTRVKIVRDIWRSYKLFSHTPHMPKLSSKREEFLEVLKIFRLTFLRLIQMALPFLVYVCFLFFKQI